MRGQGSSKRPLTGRIYGCRPTSSCLKPFANREGSIYALSALDKDAIERRQRQDEQAFKDRLLSVRDYYDRKLALEQALSDREIASTGQELAAAKAAVARARAEGDQDRVNQALAEQVRVEAELEILRRKREDLAPLNARERLEAQLNRLGGDRAKILDDLADGEQRVAQAAALSGDRLAEEQALDAVRADALTRLQAMARAYEDLAAASTGAIRAQALTDLEDLRLKIGEVQGQLAHPQRDPMAGFTAGWTGYVAEARNVGAQITQTMGRAFDTVEQKMTDFLTTGKQTWKGFGAAVAGVVDDLIRDLTRLAVKQAIVGAIMGLAGGGSQRSADLAAWGGVHHSGGIAGAPAVRRRVDPAVFLAAPRYHSGGIAGLRADEVPAILQRGEEVLTRDDPRHRANLAPQSIRVEIRNEGTPQRVVSAEPRFDARGLVVSVLTADLATNGPVAQAMAGVFNLRR